MRPEEAAQVLKAMSLDMAKHPHELEAINVAVSILRDTKLRPTAARLRELLRFDPSTGRIHWLISRGTIKAGAIAGSMCKGRHIVRVDTRVYQTARVVWCLHYGIWPSLEIDHINGDKSDNRIENLRDVSRAVNQQNQRKALANNKTGFLGVIPENGRFRAQIRHKQKTLYLGIFDTPEEAHAAYVEAKRRVHPGCTL